MQKTEITKSLDINELRKEALGVDTDYPIESENKKNEQAVINFDNDPNEHMPEIIGNEPIVVFWGPKTCGKTVAISRLSRYLNKNHYVVKPDKQFIRKPYYEALCDRFDRIIAGNTAPKGNGEIDFLLLQVTKNGKKICHLLEAPGEHYFSVNDPDAEFKTYFSSIVSSDVPKVYVFFLEIIDIDSQQNRQKYSERIANFIGNIRKNDFIVLLCNKADLKTMYGYLHNGKPEIQKFKKDVQNLYPAIFNKLGRKGFLKFFLAESYAYDLVVFSAGSFPKKMDGENAFVQSPDFYPETLWKSISKGLRGSWF